MLQTDQIGQSSITCRIKSWEIVYPPNCKSINAKNRHKEKILQENPEVLYADYAQHEGHWKKCNLIFFTNCINPWRDTLIENYPHVHGEGIVRGGRLKVCKDQSLDKDDPLLTISYYQKGKIKIQGNSENLDSFEEVFPLLKEKVNEKRTNNHQDNYEDDSPLETIAAMAISTPPTPHNSDRQLRENLANLELEFTEFKQVQARQLYQLKEDFKQLRTKNDNTTSEMKRTLEELKQENGALRAQISKIKEDMNTQEK